MERVLHVFEYETVGFASLILRNSHLTQGTQTEWIEYGQP